MKLSKTTKNRIASAISTVGLFVFIAIAIEASERDNVYAQYAVLAFFIAIIFLSLYKICRIIIFWDDE